MEKGSACAVAGPAPYRIAAALDGFEAASQPVTIGTRDGERGHTLAPSRLTESVVVTARRVEEAAQEVPIPVSVIEAISSPTRARSTSTG